MQAYPDMDGGPTKAFLVLNREDTKYIAFYDKAFAKRPREELYDLPKYPNQMHDLAADPRYADIVRQKNDHLMEELVKTGDHRVTGDGSNTELVLV